jgi:HAD superfamily hydrolase (TIGR01544 family)
MIDNLLKNFICSDKRKVEIKLNDFFVAGKDKIYLAFDFDRTITPYFNGAGELVSTWDLLSKKMPPDIRALEMALYKKYQPLEAVGKITVDDAIEWWSRNLDLYEKSKLKWSDLELEVEEAIPARPGAKDLFQLCDDKKIPAIIISAGLWDVIELWCKKFEVYPESILSTKLFFDEKGFICGWDKDSLVHIMNKKMIGKQYLHEMQKTRPFALLIGDSMDDAEMVDGTDNVLRFFIDDQQDKKVRGDDFYDHVFKKFDLIIQSQNLSGIVETIELMR